MEIKIGDWVKINKTDALFNQCYVFDIKGREALLLISRNQFNRWYYWWYGESRLEFFFKDSPNTSCNNLPVSLGI